MAFPGQQQQQPGQGQYGYAQQARGMNQGQRQVDMNADDMYTTNMNHASQSHFYQHPHSQQPSAQQPAGYWQQHHHQQLPPQHHFQQPQPQYQYAYPQSQPAPGQHPQSSLSQVLQQQHRLHQQPPPPRHPPPQSPSAHYAAPPSTAPSFYTNQPDLHSPQQPQHYPSWSQPVYSYPQAYVQIPGSARQSPPHPNNAPPSQTPRRPSQHVPPRPPQTQQPGPRPSQSPHLQSASNPTPPPLSHSVPTPKMPASHGPRVETPRPTPKPQSRTPSSSQQPHTSQRSIPTPSSQPAAARKVVAHVEIPIQRTPGAASQDRMAPAVKRRRSNEDGAYCESFPSKDHPTSTPGHVDYQATLLSLADEYTRAAYSIGPAVASAAATPEQITQYQTLVATAMRCMESALENTRFSDPRKEASVRIQLATLMLDETENLAEVEDLLTKGIPICDRNKLQDMKYAMQHLLVRIFFRSREQAAFRLLDRTIEEVTALRVYHWMYAFRFLRVSLTFHHQNATSILLRHLSAITNNAEAEGHTSVGIVAAMLEALVHLRSGMQDAVQLAQRSLANVRMHQLSPEMQNMPQFRILLDMLDLTCNMVECRYDGLGASLSNLQNNMQELLSEAEWPSDGTVLIPLGIPAKARTEADAAGILKLVGGEVALKFSWLTKSQLHATGFLLSGLVRGCNNTADGKAGEFLKEGLKLVNQLPNARNQSHATARSTLDWQKSMNLLFSCHLIFGACGRSDWPKAQTMLQQLDTRLEAQDLIADDTMDELKTYLGGMIQQGLGDLETAHTFYKDSRLSFEDSAKFFTAKRDLQVLASLNNILLLRCLSQHDQLVAGLLLSSIEPYCRAHHNTAIQSAFYVVMATMDTADGRYKTKEHLQEAVKKARSFNSTRLLCVCMNIMTSLFFHNVIGEQSEKSATASRSLALKAKDRLWVAVADGNFSRTLELAGKHTQCQQVRDEAQRNLSEVPEAVKRRIQDMYD